MDHTTTSLELSLKLSLKPLSYLLSSLELISSAFEHNVPDGHRQTDRQTQDILSPWAPVRAKNIAAHLHNSGKHPFGIRFIKFHSLLKM